MNVTRAWRMALGLLVSACIALSPSLAYAEDDSPAYEIFDNYLSQSNSVAEFNNYLIIDLANRWFYADAIKRAKLPVVQSAWTNVDGSLETILEEAGGNPSDAAYQFSTCQAIVSYVDVPAIPSQLYKLVTLDDALAWDSTAMLARDYYRDWYEWFEGTPGGEPLQELVTPQTLDPVFGKVFWSGGAWHDVVSNGSVTVNVSDISKLRTSANNRGLRYFAWLAYSNYPLSSGSSISTNFTVVIVGSASPLSIVDNGVVMVGDTAVHDVWISSESTLYRNYQSYGTNYGYFGAFTFSSVNMMFPPSVSGVDSPTSTPVASLAEWYYPSTGAAKGVVGLYSSMAIATGSGSGDPVYPPYPTPPDPDNPTVPSEPSNITINWGDINFTSNQNTTTTVDLQPILDALRIVNDNLESGFLGLEADIRLCYDGMEHLLTSWFEYFGSWFQTISTQLDTWFRLFLQEMRTANSWLRAIYYKSWGGNSSQPDITSDTDDYWNWWYELLGRIIEMLPDSLQEIITQLAQLQNYFPFSVPWDVAFLLGLLDAEPVTPVIHGYLPTWGSNGFVAQGVPLDIDLTEFDDIALLLRRAELLFFAVTLLPATYDVLKGFREVLHS